MNDFTGRMTFLNSITQPSVDRDATLHYRESFSLR